MPANGEPRRIREDESGADADAHRRKTLVGLAGLAGAAAVAGRIAFERQMAGEIDALLAAGRPAASGTVREGISRVSCVPVKEPASGGLIHQDPPSSE